MWRSRPKISRGLGLVAPCLGAFALLGAEYGGQVTRHCTSSDEFEVASIKPVNEAGKHMVGTTVFPGGRTVLKGMSLKAVVAEAYDMPYWEVTGGERWMEKDLYDIEAIPPDGLRSKFLHVKFTLFGIEDQDLRQMLQHLLAARFKLKLHQESRTGRVYVLVREKQELPLQFSDKAESIRAGNGGSIGFAGQWVIANTTMTELAKFASAYYLHAPVEDHTHLTGTFSYKSRPEDWDDYQQDPTGSFLRFVSSMGLKFKPESGLVDVLVIDNADRPSPN